MRNENLVNQIDPHKLTSPPLSEKILTKCVICETILHAADRSVCSLITSYFCPSCDSYIFFQKCRDRGKNRL